jgi:hypothetical protein
MPGASSTGPGIGRGQAPWSPVDDIGSGRNVSAEECVQSRDETFWVLELRAVGNTG